MLNVILTIHMIACVALVIAIMLQRSEGGALGMSGGGTGGVISGRGAAGMLVKVTMGLALTFFVTSITMTWLNNQANSAPGILERQIQQEGQTNPLGTGGLTTTPAPTTTTPAAPAPAPVIDPLAPATPATTPPATGAATPATTTPAPAAPATTTPDPVPAPAPAENGGSNN
jgi:preprotein translocase subunit SecG